MVASPASAALGRAENPFLRFYRNRQGAPIEQAAVICRAFRINMETVCSQASRAEKRARPRCPPGAASGRAKRKRARLRCLPGTASGSVNNKAVDRYSNQNRDRPHLRLYKDYLLAFTRLQRKGRSSFHSNFAFCLALHRTQARAHRTRQPLDNEANRSI